MKEKLNLMEIIPANDLLNEELNNIKGGYSPDEHCEDGCHDGNTSGGHKGKG